MNKTLEDGIGELLKENKVMKNALTDFEFQVENKLKKTLKIMHSDTFKLQHVLIMGKPYGNHQGLRYERECSSYKIVFVKEYKIEKP